MCRLSCVLVLTLAFNLCHGEFVDSSHFRQQGARVTYFDRKYFKDLSVFTAHPNRNSPYVTTFNGTILVPIGNNVTVSIQVYNVQFNLPLVNWEIRTCDILKVKWMKDFILKYTDITSCPMPPGTYHIQGVELPPKNFPIPLEKVDYRAKQIYYLTKSKERILEISMEFKYERPKKN